MRKNLPLNRSLVLGFGALCVTACGAGSEDLAGKNGRLSAGDADQTGQPAAQLAECEEGREPVAEAHTIALWPPNHKLHTIALADCVSLSCDDGGSAEFLYATSDEPVDDIGDGHHSPDIGLDEAGNVCVRSERQGPKNGRVYHLGVRYVDGNGAETLSECTIVVDHDQSAAVTQDDGESYRVTFDGTATELAACDPVEVPPGDGDGDEGVGDGDGDGDTGDGDGDVPPIEPGDGDGDGDGPVVDPL